MSLQLNEISSGYENKSVLKNINLEVKSHETLVLMGPSGSGKSTLLLTILGIIKQKNGQIILNNKDISDLPIESRNIGYLQQDYGLFPHLNVFDNVCYGLSVRGKSKEEKEKVVTEVLQIVNLNGMEKRKINELSGGQKQRVGLARALAIKPDLLLLDEPLSSIDQITKAEVCRQLRELFSKLDVPIILVTHNYEEMAFFSEKVAILVDGKIEQIGSFGQIRKKPKTEIVKKIIVPFWMDKK